MGINFKDYDLSTVEGTLAGGLAAALGDVVALRATRESIAKVLTDEAAAQFGAGFAQYSEIGLADFVAMQPKTADKVAAFVAVTQSPGMLGFVAVRKITDLGELHSALGMARMIAVIEGPLGALNYLSQRAAAFIGLEDTDEAADKYALGLVTEAVEESIKGRPDLPSVSVRRS